MYWEKDLYFINHNKFNPNCLTTEFTMFDLLLKSKGQIGFQYYGNINYFNEDTIQFTSKVKIENGSLQIIKCNNLILPNDLYVEGDILIEGCVITKFPKKLFCTDITIDYCNGINFIDSNIECNMLTILSSDVSHINKSKIKCEDIMLRNDRF